MATPSRPFGRRSPGHGAPAADSRVDTDPSDATLAASRMRRPSPSAAETLIEALQQGRPEGTRFLLFYQDAEWNMSGREVIISAIERSYDVVYLHAYCLKRRDWRTFRADRIVEMANADTGEMIEDPEPMLARAMQIRRRRTVGTPGRLPDGRHWSDLRGGPADPDAAQAIVGAMRRAHAEALGDGVAGREPMPATQRIALQSAATGAALAFGLLLLWPHFPWWVYLVFALIAMAGAHKGLIQAAAHEALIDRSDRR